MNKRTLHSAPACVLGASVRPVAVTTFERVAHLVEIYSAAAAAAAAAADAAGALGGGNVFL